MKKFRVRVEYTFTGYVDVNAENGERAKDIVRNDFGMVAGNISTSNISECATDEGVIDWVVGTHPEKKKLTYANRPLD